MDGFWKNALKVSGPVAIVGFLLYATINHFFDQRIIDLFGDEQRFIFVLILILGLLICLLAAIISFTAKSKVSGLDTGNKAVFKKTTIQGDVVQGNKNITGSDDE